MLHAVRDLLDRGALAVVGDLSNLEQTRSVAHEANQIGPFHAIIHNAGVYSGRDVVPDAIDDLPVAVSSSMQVWTQWPDSSNRCKLDSEPAYTYVYQ